MHRNHGQNKTPEDAVNSRLRNVEIFSKRLLLPESTFLNIITAHFKSFVIIIQK